MLRLWASKWCALMVLTMVVDKAMVELFVKPGIDQRLERSIETATKLAGGLVKAPKMTSAECHKKYG